MRVNKHTKFEIKRVGRESPRGVMVKVLDCSLEVTSSSSSKNKYHCENYETP